MTLPITNPGSMCCLPLARCRGIRLSLQWRNLMWERRSRSITFPEPSAISGDGSSAVISREGIVPGLDFCNHDANAQARWSIWNEANTKVCCCVLAPDCLLSTCGNSSNTTTFVPLGAKCTVRILRLLEPCKNSLSARRPCCCGLGQST